MEPDPTRVESERVSLQAVPPWKAFVALLVGFAAVAVPLMIVLSLASISGFKPASCVSDQMRGALYSEGAAELLFDNILLGVMHSIFWSVTLAVSIWIGSRVHTKVVRDGSRMLLDFRMADLGDSIMIRPGIRDIVENLSFVQCLADLSIGTSWTAVVVGVPIITVLIVFGKIGGSVENKMSWYFVPPIFATLLVFVTTPVLLLGFRLIRPVLKLMTNHANVTA